MKIVVIGHRFDRKRGLPSIVTLSTMKGTTSMAEILKDVRDSYTFRLLKNRPSFLGGLSASIDISSRIEDNYNTNSTEEEADTKSLEADWKAVGSDMRSALDRYGRSRNS